MKWLLVLIFATITVVFSCELITPTKQTAPYMPTKQTAPYIPADTTAPIDSTLA